MSTSDPSETPDERKAVATHGTATSRELSSPSPSLQHRRGAGNALNPSATMTSSETAVEHAGERLPSGFSNVAEYMVQNKLMNLAANFTREAQSCLLPMAHKIRMVDRRLQDIPDTAPEKAELVYEQVDQLAKFYCITEGVARAHSRPKPSKRDVQMVHDCAMSALDDSLREEYSARVQEEDPSDYSFLSGPMSPIELWFRGLAQRAPDYLKIASEKSEVSRSVKYKWWVSPGLAHLGKTVTRLAVLAPMIVPFATKKLGKLDAEMEVVLYCVCILWCNIIPMCIARSLDTQILLTATLAGVVAELF